MSVYIGQELELFANAKNWNNYLNSQLKNLIKGDVLEVGAGIGTKTKYLFNDHVNSWICLEPDSNLAVHIEELIQSNQFHQKCVLQVGTIDQIPFTSTFDTILYIDVIEHLINDQEELSKALAHLNKGGLLIVLTPAHNQLFSKFDVEIGHYRRYNKKMVQSYQFENAVIEKLRYLDCFGLIGSYSNKVLRQTYPSKFQIVIWDKLLVSLSRIFDPLFNYRMGKSLLTVWKKTN